MTLELIFCCWRGSFHFTSSTARTGLWLLYLELTPLARRERKTNGLLGRRMPNRNRTEIATNRTEPNRTEPNQSAGQLRAGNGRSQVKNSDRVSSAPASAQRRRRGLWRVAHVLPALPGGERRTFCLDFDAGARRRCVCAMPPRRRHCCRLVLCCCCCCCCCCCRCLPSLRGHTAENEHPLSTLSHFFRRRPILCPELCPLCILVCPPLHVSHEREILFEVCGARAEQERRSSCQGGRRSACCVGSAPGELPRPRGYGRGAHRQHRVCFREVHKRA